MCSGYEYYQSIHSSEPCEIFSSLTNILLILQVSKYKLYGKALKRALTNHLVTPVQAHGDHVIAFRIVWRVYGDRLARAWDAITSQRHLCDEVVARTESVQMFVSCISGVFNTSAACRDELNPVYPAVSYWTVCGGETAEVEMTRRLMVACPGAQVKRVHSYRFRQLDESPTADSQKLFIVLKDHSSDYVYQKITRGAVDVIQRPPNAQLFVLSHSKYRQEVASSVEALKAVGLRIDAGVVDGM